MKKMYKSMMMAGAMALSMGATSAHAEDDSGVSIAGDIGVVSQYVFRGVTQTSGKPAVQGDLSAGIGNVTASLWFSNAYPSPVAAYAGRDVVETDWGLDYSDSIGDTGLSYSVGGVWYAFMYDSGSNYGEAYAALSYDAVVSPSVKAYYTVKDSFNKAFLKGDLWVDMSLSGSAGGFDLSGTLSYANWKKDAVNRPLAAPGVDMFKSGLELATVAVSKDVEVAGVTMTPSLTYNYPLAKKQADGNRYIYGLPVKSEFVAGVNFSY